LALTAWPADVSAATSIADAARADDLAAVRALIAGAEDVNLPAADGSTALLWAAYNADVEMVAALLAAGANPDAANRFGVTPLLQASGTGDAETLRALLDGGADPQLAHPEGETPLMAAARTGHVDAVQLLLERGADVNARDAFQEQTALMWAAAEGHVEVVDVLLAAGADPNLKARVNSLTDRSVNVDFPTGGFTALMWAARGGHENVVRRLVAGGADLNLTNGDAASAMMIAIVNDRFDLAAVLLELGADANDGSLYHAVEMRDATTDWYAHDGSKLRNDYSNERTALDLVALLLEAGADPNKLYTGQLHSSSMCCDTTANATPFYRAAVAADVEALKLMVARGADVEWTPSKPANGGGGPGANANVGRTALMVAINGGRGVSQSGGPGNLREGQPPFREASNRAPGDAVRVLLEAGANPDALAPDGSAAIHQATLAGQVDVIRALAAAGAKLDITNKDGRTALYLAENPPPPRPLIAGAPRDYTVRATPAEVATLLRELMASAGASAEPKVAAITE
jgi:ankyrin repeat protein